MSTPKNSATTQIALAFVFILIAMASRFLPHPPNFTAIGALALFAPLLFAGARLPKSFAIFLPLAVLFLSDLVIGFYPGLTFVYLGFALVAVLGLLLRPQKSWGRALVSAPLATAVFFAFSNFGVWFSTGLYEMSFSGLVQCYAMALPFLGNQLAGDLTFVLGFAAAYRLLQPTVAARSVRSSQPLG